MSFILRPTDSKRRIPGLFGDGVQAALHRREGLASKEPFRGLTKTKILLSVVVYDWRSANWTRLWDGASPQKIKARGGTQVEIATFQNHRRAAVNSSVIVIPLSLKGKDKVVF